MVEERKNQNDCKKEEPVNESVYVKKDKRNVQMVLRLWYISGIKVRLFLKIIWRVLCSENIIEEIY